ncbi:hypothetical protein [Nocardiopsis sp. SBT366]|uniref:hypothetical protein n=1 Tax=Nocardiopsis sp. SBT366 TaxID=1580529 RepID=UPI00066AEAB1|nr:hypothetical protein [Nocardiopsis sp. SBT366]
MTQPGFGGQSHAETREGVHEIQPGDDHQRIAVLDVPPVEVEALTPRAGSSGGLEDVPLTG